MMLLKNRIRVVALQVWNILRQSRSFHCWRYACWSLAYTMWTFSCSEGPLNKTKDFLPVFRTCDAAHRAMQATNQFLSLAKFCFVLFLFQHLKNTLSIVSSIACNAWPFLRVFCFNFIVKNQFSQLNIKTEFRTVNMWIKKFIQPRFKYSLACSFSELHWTVLGKQWRSFLSGQGNEQSSYIY